MGQGFPQTAVGFASFADVADAVGISRGNFYHHFKSKDEILEAVIEARLAATRQMLERWESEGERPADRIRSFINILIANRAKIMLHGCPVGTLCAELAKLDHASQAEANKLVEIEVGKFDTAWAVLILINRSSDGDAFDSLVQQHRIRIGHEQLLGPNRELLQRFQIGIGA